MGTFTFAVIEHRKIAERKKKKHETVAFVITE
jgi:hypothetical protein